MKKLKSIIFFIVLLLITFIFYKTYIIVFEELKYDTKNNKIKSYTIPNLDKDGYILQKSKEELKGVVEQSSISIEEIQYEYPNVKIKGEVEYINSTKAFYIEGTLKNTGGDNKNRIILSGKDKYNNFDVLDCSFYYKTEWLNPFNRELNDWQNKSVNTLYLLDNENRNITFCESIANGKKLKKGIELINIQDELEIADVRDINWLEKVFNVIGTSIEENQNVVQSLSETPYTYLRTFTYLGDHYIDKLDILLSIKFYDRLTLGGSISGEAKIQCMGGTFLNESTGAKTNSRSVLGTTANTIIEISMEGINNHGFTKYTTSGCCDKVSKVKVSTSLGNGSPKTDLRWLKQPSETSLNNGFEFCHNSILENSFTRGIQTTFDSGHNLHYSNHYFATSFSIADFNNEIRQNGKVTVWFKLPFYNSFDGKSDVIRIGKTLTYCQ